MSFGVASLGLSETDDFKCPSIGSSLLSLFSEERKDIEVM
jgi:hypothetical protein